jgi:diguanylate cyclase (GGDEF)-like protein
MKKKKIVSFSGCGLRYKLRIVFYLILILPILISIFVISNYFLPFYKWNINLLILILLGFFIALIGFLLIYDITGRLIHVSSEAKSIASGRLDRPVSLVGEDEIKELAEAINSLQLKIRQDMQQLNLYSQRTAEYNLKIQRQSLLLSSLLQINSFVFSGKDIDSLLKIALERLSQLMNSSVSYLLLKQEDTDELYIRSISGLEIPNYVNIKLELTQEIKQIFERSIREHSIILIDSKSDFSKELIQEFFSCFKIKNALFFPMYSHNEFLGFLGTGNKQEDFIYNNEDIELMEVLARNISLILEINKLLNRLDKLEIKDSLTALYNERFIRWRLQEEIKRGMLYQRPCSFILFRINNFTTLYEQFGIRFAEDVLKKIAKLLAGSVSEIDYVGRFGDYTFAVILVEKNKRQSIECAKDIRKKIEFAFAEEEPQRRVTLTEAVSENPLDGITAEELINKAEEILRTCQ